MLDKTAIIGVRFYQYCISGLFGGRCCRFTPHCSEYAICVIQKFGFFKGCCLTAKRILCCHPWHPGGYDPPPEG